MMTKIIMIISVIAFTFISYDCERYFSSSYNLGKTESLVLDNPKGGETFFSDDLINVQWSSANVAGNIRIELLIEDESVYSENNIPNTGKYFLQIPDSLVPSEKYKLRIISMADPEISDITNSDFKIFPQISGNWFYSDIVEDTGLEISLELVSFFNNSFLGSGRFHFKYLDAGNAIDYLRQDTVGGIFNFPDISFVMREQGNKEFNFIGKMITNNKIKGRIFGFIDSTYGNLADSLTLIRQ